MYYYFIIIIFAKIHTMISNQNPFITNGYLSNNYFCGRKTEKETLIRELTNGNNVALISTRRMGKTGLIMNCFESASIQKKYYTFFVDIYSTASMRDFVFLLSKAIIENLKPFGKRALQRFLECVKSIHAGLSFDITGTPKLTMGLGDIRSAEATLDEIFEYLNGADKPCIVAIDEFQQIANYPEKNVESLLRTYLQRSKNAHFIFAGSQQHFMGSMFLSPARPFYQSVSIIHLDAIPLDEYSSFAIDLFKKGRKELLPETVESIYNKFDGITWYLQKILHQLYNTTPNGEQCTENLVEPAVSAIIDSFKYPYSEILYRTPLKQKELLIAIAKEGAAESLTSSDFIRKHSLSSSSSVQAALKALLEKDFVTRDEGIYRVYDRFFAIWLKENY